MSSRLPFEILATIATHISQKDKLTCSTVCKSWAPSFQVSLWRTLDINENRIEAICSTSSTGQSIYSINGNRVQTLRFEKSVEATDDQLHTVQQTFQQLKRLEIEQHGLSKDHFGQKADWSLWKSLTALELYLPELDDKIRKYEMFKILSCLPSLTQLDLEAKLEETRPNYTWEMLENIHVYLPQLEYLHTNLPLAAISSKDIKRINLVTPAKNLSVIKLLDHNMDLGWLFYFSLKYPKVRSIESCMAFSKLNRIEDVPSEEVLSMIMAASFQFPQLKSVVISHEAVVGSQHTIFWKLLHQLTTSLRSLDYSLDLTNYGNMPFSGFPRESVRFSSTTLERLSLIINAKPHVMSVLPLNLGSCSRLVDLTTEVSKGIIEIDVLLDSCTSLKSIHMRDELITLSPKAFATSTPHGLQKMEIINSKVDSHVFNFISLRCRQLREMTLCFVKVPGSISQETGNMCIDMSYTHFEVLRLHNVMFYWLSGEIEAVNDEESGSRSLLRPYETYNINLIAIERLNSVLRPRHLGAPKPLGHDGQDNGAVIDKRAWFHHYWGSSDSERSRQVWMLGKPQVKHIQDYFESFQTSSANDCLSNENRYPMGLVVKRFWKRDLSRGYATLRCGYIGSYDIDGTHFDHDLDVL